MQKPIDGFKPFRFMFLPYFKGKKIEFYQNSQDAMLDGWLPTYMLRNPENQVFQTIKNSVASQGIQDELEGVMFLVNYREIPGTA